MLYFAYGSNMSTPRIVERVPSTTFHCLAFLPGYVMKFNKHSVDGSAKCNIENTGNPDDVVYGVVFNLLQEEKPWLDHYEGLGHGYDAIELTVCSENGADIDVYAYIGRDLVESIMPYHWYKEHVLRGAREHRLPDEYIHSIEVVESMTDPDPATSDRELSIYF